MGSSAVLVAPREIGDLVDRASRVHGCTVADAGRLAADVTFCEIHHGGGLAAWLELASRGPGALPAAVAAARALDVVALDVLDRAASDDVVDDIAGEQRIGHRWSEPLPYVLLARSRAAWAQRGVAAAIAADHGTDPVSEVWAHAAEPRLVDERRGGDALARGVRVDRAAWLQLEAAGAAFLMPEAMLDAAAGR